MRVTTADVFARGLWEARGEAPLLVSDPLKARHLLGLDRKPPSARARRRHEAGLLPIAYFRSATPLLSKSSLREIERLISGGDLLWADEYHNLVVNEGLNDLLDVTLRGGTTFIGPRGSAQELDLVGGADQRCADRGAGRHHGFARRVDRSHGLRSDATDVPPPRLGRRCRGVRQREQQRWSCPIRHQRQRHHRR